MIDIIPGIFEKDFDELVRKIDLIAAHVTSVHIDIADKTFVEAESFLDFSKLASIISKYPHISFEAHLMVANPVKYIRPLVDAGFTRLIAHIECTDPRQFLGEVELENVEVGLAIDAHTQIDELEPFIEEIDQVLVMTIEAGVSNLPFLPETVEKIRAIHEQYPHVSTEVDGGIDERTIKIVKDAGATRIVSTYFIFHDLSNAADAIRRLKMA